MNILSINSTALKLIIIAIGLNWYTSMKAQSYYSADLELIPIEHASLVLKSSKTTIAIDPTSKSNEFSERISFVLITDIHGDHYNKEQLESIAKATTKIIAPQAVYDKMDQRLKDQTTVLDNGEIYRDTQLIIKAIPMYNLRKEALNFHTKGRGNGYVITLDGQRIYISGDTEDIDEMRALKNIDIALVCMNLPYTMTETSAANAVMEFKPKVIIPYHYRGRPKVSDLDVFESLITDKAIKVVRLDWYPNDPY